MLLPEERQLELEERMCKPLKDCMNGILSKMLVFVGDEVEVFLSSGTVRAEIIGVIFLHKYNTFHLAFQVRWKDDSSPNGWGFGEHMLKQY